MNKIIACAVLQISIFAACSFSKILDSLIIEGLVINNRSVITNNVLFHEQEQFTSLDVQQSVKMLYQTGIFKSVDVFVVNETDSSASLLLKVKENSVCESIEYHGYKKLKPKEFDPKITLKKGQMVSEARVFENIKILQDLYAEKGYLLADITCDLIDTKIPGNVIAKFTIKEGQKVRIDKITFTGNKNYSSRRLHWKLKTKERKLFSSGEYNKDKFQSHLDSLIMFYQNKGFLDARIVKDSVWYGDNKKDIYVAITIEEGKRYYTGNFFFTGNKILEKEALSSRIAMKKGKAFDKSKFDMTKYFIAGAYREEGYLWVQVQEQNRYRGDTIDVTFSITEGKPAIVRRVDVKNNNKTREIVIRRELVIYPAQKYRQSLMEISTRRVMQLGFFNNVLPDLHPNEDGTIDLVFTVEEKDNIGQFSAGVTYSQTEHFGGNFTISIPNFRGAGEKLDANVLFSKYSQRYSLGFTEPWVFNTPTSFNIIGAYDRENTIYRDAREIYIEFGGERRVAWPDDNFFVSAGYHIGYKRDSYIHQISLQNVKVQDTGTLSKLLLGVRRNELDKRTFPTRGSLLLINAEIAGLGGNYSFVKGTVEYNWYFPLLWKFVLGVQTKFGLLSRLGSSMVIDFGDLFSAGGVYGVDGVIRGYDEGAFGRYQGRGLTMLTFSGQVYFPVLENQLYLAGFADLGNVWDDVADIDLKDMYPGVGAGFRLDLPMLGLIGFDLAWGLKNPNNPHFDGKPNGLVPHFILQRGF